jgi:hypothetical protein
MPGGIIAILVVPGNGFMVMFPTYSIAKIAAETVVDWRDGIRSQIEHLAADLLR